ASLKKLGFDVEVIEGWYNSTVVLDEEGRITGFKPLNYHEVAVPIKNLETMTRYDYKIIYSGKDRKVKSRKGINTDNVSIVQLGDDGWADPNDHDTSLTETLYGYDRAPHLPKTFLDFAIWFSKSGLEYVIRDEIKALRA